MDSYGGGGGGFMSSQTDQSPGGGSKSKGDKGMLPVTIKQILLAPMDSADDILKVDGREAQQITFIGQVLEIGEQSTNITYNLFDGTGSIPVKQWVDTDEGDYQASVRQGLTEGRYVRVVGQLRMYHQDRSVNAFNIRPVEDMNEITYHLLDVCHAHLYNTRGPAKETVDKPLKPAFGASNPSMGGAGGSAAPFQAPNAGASNAGGTVQEQVLSAFVEMCQGIEAQGVNVQDVATRLGISVNACRDAVEGLALDGHLYSTVDEMHYATT